MITDYQLDRIIQDQAKSFARKDPGTPRSINLFKYLYLNQVIIISGVRRCGKTTLLRQIASHFKAYHYLNLADIRLHGLSDLTASLLLLEKRDPGIRILFLDEIQNLPGCEDTIRQLHDSGYKIFCTSSQIGTNISHSDKPKGEWITIILHPFSFVEYLAWHAIDKSTASENQVAVLSHLDRYLEEGGFPEYTRMWDTDHIRSIYEEILYRDCIARWNIRDVSGFIRLAGFLLTNIGTKVHYRSLASMLGMKSPMTVRDYIHILADTHLITEVHRYDPSLKKQYGTGKKIYAVDIGMRNQVAFRVSGDHQKLLENLVLVELKRRDFDVYYHFSAKECDFVIIENGQVNGLYQVCSELTDLNREREYGGLQEAMNQYGLDWGILITLNQEGTVRVPEGVIQIVPVWKWLLYIEEK